MSDVYKFASTLPAKAILVDATERSMTVPAGSHLRIWCEPPASGVARVHYGWAATLTRFGSITTTASAASSGVVTSLEVKEIAAESTTLYFRADSLANLGSGFTVIVEAFTPSRS